ncbi:DUF885 domain-containing protein [Undibacterium cyanobacteriorum]|uniref:DUF885 domain-containing protein n=1 Tax=Undibacterium cyanobacteriorum TaxID=3073561 RepID=A0ABY9RKP9_9BURK|nr:DUF885 domain-containing protein [Undibacterium sp. 20NA77.5]WMW80621.1 DUF885 domain-containing protein [Undibacterium sp. 20NA77.5]
MKFFKLNLSLSILIVALFCAMLGVPRISVSAEVGQSKANNVAQYIANYSKNFQRLGLGGDLAFAYQQQIDRILREKNQEAQARFVAQLEQDRQHLETSGVLQDANQCQRLQLAIIDFEANLLRDKIALTKAYKALGQQAVMSEQGLAHSSMGKEWYRYLSKAWLSSDISPDDLVKMGTAELDRALDQYRRLQRNMGYEGRDAAFAAYLNSAVFQYEDGTTPQADYEKRQSTVYQNLGKLFLPNAVRPPAIRASSRGMSFPVDGYYIPEEGAFYFNKAKSHYDRRSLDWLLLHESTPGHHFQNRYTENQDACAKAIPHSFYSTFIEGWGAYVEEYGHELGLYQTDADELGAVEWNLVRSIRVILDVGINHFSWSDQQAKAFWFSRLPMLPELAEREIKRVRNWPAQAITYKLGAVKFRQLRDQERQRLGEKFSLQVFHHAVLKNGPLPIEVLQ